MKFLLDANVIFWMLTNRGRLTWRIMAILRDDDNELFVSLASIWELTIKIAKGKLLVPGGNAASLLDELRLLDVRVVPIEEADILRTQTLPHHHGDPFDRMLVAQALERNLTILTSDEKIPLYSAPVIWA